MKSVDLRVVNGAVFSAPVYETHERGKNWFAVIDINPTMPGGLARDFVRTGRGECLYIVEQVTRFDAVEFGADYVTGAGRKYPKRWYGVVVEKQSELLRIVECKSGAEAVLLAKDMRSGVVTP
jgi:hypothetical protein